MKDGKRQWIWFAGLGVAVLAVATVVAFIVPHEQTTARLHEWVASAGPWAPAVFVVFYAVAILLFIPGSLLTLAAGILFGPWWGLLWAWLGANLGAQASYGVARLGGDKMNAWVKARLPAAVKDLDDHSFSTLLTLRLMFFIPDTAISYAAGFARTSWRAYVPATMLGYLPGTMAFALAGGAATIGPDDPWFWVALGGAAVVMGGLALGSKAFFDRR